MSIEFISVKNFDKWQHYKDRTPPWIKLHRDILNDYSFMKLADEAKAHLVLIWLLASQVDNKIPNDSNYVSSRIGSKLPVDLESLLRAGFLTEWIGTGIKDPQFSSRYISKQIKEEVWIRDGGRCKGCESKNDLEYDHIIPVSQGGNSDENNVQLLCRGCNRKKRVRSMDSFSAEHRSEHVAMRETETEAYKEEAETDTPLPPKPKKETKRETGKRLEAYLETVGGKPSLEWGSYARENYNWDAERLNAAWRKFLRVFTSADCKRPVKKDWYGAWCNFVDRDADQSHGNKQPSGAMPSKSLTALSRAMASRRGVAGAPGFTDTPTRGGPGENRGADSGGETGALQLGLNSQSSEG